jgi:hypothetical protein
MFPCVVLGEAMLKTVEICPVLDGIILVSFPLAMTKPWKFRSVVL